MSSSSCALAARRFLKTGINLSPAKQLLDIVYVHSKPSTPFGDNMAKIATGAKQTLSDTLLTLSWSGLGSNDELEIHLNDESFSLASLQLDPKLNGFMRRPNNQKDDFQIALDKIPRDIQVVSFVLNTNEHGPFAWSVLGHTTDEDFQSDAIIVGLNLRCYLLKFTRTGDKWDLENVNIPVLASGTVGVPLYLVSEEVRGAAQYAAFRNLARDRKQFVALIDLTASMSPWLQQNAHLVCMEAISAVSATVTRKFLPVSLNGLRDVEIEAGSAGRAILQQEIRSLTSKNLVSQPLHSLIPELIKTMDSKTVLYVISDEIPAIMPDTVKTLEEKDVDLNLVLIGQDSIVPRLTESPRLRVSKVGDVLNNTPVEKVLDALS